MQCAVSGIFFHCFSIIVVWGFKYLFFVLDFTQMASNAKEMFDAIRAKYEAEKREKEEQQKEKEVAVLSSSGPGRFRSGPGWVQVSSM